jgi:hypothetical protein
LSWSYRAARSGMFAPTAIGDLSFWFRPPTVEGT